MSPEGDGVGPLVRIGRRVFGTYYGLNTIGGRNVTAVDAGGHYDDAIHTDSFHDGWGLSAPGGGCRFNSAVTIDCE